MPTQDPFKVPKAMQVRCDEIGAITDRVCQAQLNADYAQLCRKAIAALSRKRPSPLQDGKALTWAAGITNAMGRVNFLTDKSQQPYLSTADLAKAFGIGQSTMSKKTSEIWELLDLMQFHPDYCLPNLIEQNPLIWMLSVNGFIIDIRTAPLDTQIAAFQQGHIPYVPAFKDRTEAEVAKLIQAEIAQFLPDRGNEELEDDDEGGLLELPPPTAVYQLKITLKESKPPIWRRVLVPDNFPLGALHIVIQEVMGWGDVHLHEFEIDRAHYGPDEGESDFEIVDEGSVLLANVIRKQGQKFLYTYDFGDDWEHVVAVEKILPVDEQQTYPQCIAGARACPPDDVGGVWGYAEFLAAIGDPEHPEHETMIEWIGGDFDPEEFDLEAINAMLQPDISE